MWACWFLEKEKAAARNNHREKILRKPRKNKGGREQCQSPLAASHRGAHALRSPSRANLLYLPPLHRKELMPGWIGFVLVGLVVGTVGGMLGIGGGVLVIPAL